MAGNIHRQKKNRDFVTIDTHCLRNKDLRWDAKGLHSYLMQLPDDWKINIADLEKRSLDRRDGTMSPMRSLISAGYVYRERLSGEKGRFIGYDYHLFERPEQTIEWLTVNGKSIDGKTVNGKSATNKVLIPKRVNKNEQGEGNGKNETPPPPASYDEFMERVNAETLAVEAKKEKGINPVAPPPSFPAHLNDYICESRYGVTSQPTHTVKTTDTALPGVLIVEGVNLEPSNPTPAARILNGVNRAPLAEDSDGAQRLIMAWATNGALETVQNWYSLARRKFTPEDLELITAKFCGTYSTIADAGRRSLFFSDPVQFFRNKGRVFIQDQKSFERMNEPKNGFAQPETKYTPPPASEKIPAYTP
jgi:hypothetical protein